MKELKRRFNRFCFRNRDKGIPNLMLYITLGAAALALMNMIDPSHALYYMLCFDKEAILQGQIWRLISYPLCYAGSISIGSALMMICYYSLGRGIENLWVSLLEKPLAMQTMISFSRWLRMSVLSSSASVPPSSFSMT